MLRKRYIRDGSNRLIASVTTGYSDTSSLVRDEHEQIMGRTNDRFHTTRDKNGSLLSIDSSDPGILIGRKN